MLPKITVVTPSFNQAEFIEETILSVIGQDYANVEHIIIDGGSTDGSVDIIKSYSSHLAHWVSEKDRGQSHAINKGFERATGDIYCWLNSDDCFLPGALAHVADRFSRNPKRNFLTGGWWVLESDGGVFPARPTGVGLTPSLALLLGQHGCIGQHSTFWTRDLWESAGAIREELHYAMDHELWIRMFKSGAKPMITKRNLAVYRQQPEQKTRHGGTDGNTYYHECRRIMMEHGDGFGTVLRLKSKLATRVYQLLKHRNTHPRLGLKPPRQFDINLGHWLREVQKTCVTGNSHESPISQLTDSNQHHSKHN